MHLVGELGRRAFGSEVDMISWKVLGVDLGGFDFDDGDILSVLLLISASTDDEVRRIYNVTQRMAPTGGPMR